MINPIGYNVINTYPKTFRGNNIAPVYTNTMPLQNSKLSQDTVNFSAEEKFQNESKSKKSGLSKGAKWALGIAGTAAAVYGYVVGHRILTKPTIEKVAQNFSEIFRRDISTEEAQKIVNKYKDILDIKNTEEFCKKAFEQVKKDYGYDNLGINLKIEYMPDTKISTILSREAGASWNASDGVITLHVPDVKNAKYPLDKSQKSELISGLLHEFQHTKQTEIAYRTSPEKLAQAYEKKVSKNNMLEYINKQLDNTYALKKYAENHNITVEEAKKQLEKLKKIYNENKAEIEEGFRKARGNITEEYRKMLDKLFGKYEKLKPDSEEYNLGMKYIENQANYINGRDDYSGYRAQILEKEAHAVNDKYNKIYNYFANPWRIW